MNYASASNVRWLYDNSVYSNVEAKLRRFLVDLGNANRILGIQVCAYKDGKVIIDTAAGMLRQDDPRPVQPDSLFPCFSVTKGVTAGMVHWLADKGKLKLDDNIANFWPEFGINGKDQIKVNHVINHTSGLHSALSHIEEDHALFCDWDRCLKRITTSVPKTKPGRQQFYHALSFGWLCGGIIEYASGKKFQDVLEESFVRPLNIEGELYIGIPLGVESRVATLTIDTDATQSDMHSSFATNIVKLLNTIDGRRAVVPAANGHFSARALARYYAPLVDGGVVPPPHPHSSLPPLGSHPHHPMLPPRSNPKDANKEDPTTHDQVETKIFTHSKVKVHDAFLGRGDYKSLTLQYGSWFALGFARFHSTDGSLIGFGHQGLGGSTAYCDINNRFAIAVTLNKLSSDALTGEIIRFISSELHLPIPSQYATSW